MCRMNHKVDRATGVMLLTTRNAVRNETIKEKDRRIRQQIQIYRVSPNAERSSAFSLGSFSPPEEGHRHLTCQGSIRGIDASPTFLSWCWGPKIIYRQGSTLACLNESFVFSQAYGSFSNNLP